MEVVAGLNNGFTNEQLAQVGLEQGQVQGGNNLEIVIAFFVAGGQVAADEVVIHADGDGLQAVGHELHG